MFAEDYHFVAIATDDKMEGGQDVMDALKKDRQGGLPWMVVLDGDGKELVTSNDPDGTNVGCPVTPEEIVHFVNMIKLSSDATEDELSAINDAMQANSKKINEAREARRKKAEEAKAKKTDDG